MVHGIMAKKFNIAHLHSWQTNAIAAALNGKDSLIIQPTGTGKSMCYTIPPLNDNKTAIVISPTISLMTDQVKKLVRLEIPATLLGSAQSKDVTQQMQNNEFRIIFSTPESFYDTKKRSPRQVFMEMANRGEICLIAIDEAHLIISWQSFRLVANGRISESQCIFV